MKIVVYVPCSNLTPFHRQSPWLMFPRTFHELGYDVTLICGRHSDEPVETFRVVETGLVRSDSTVRRFARASFDPILAFREVFAQRPDIVMVGPISASLAVVLPLVITYRTFGIGSVRRHTRFVLKADLNLVDGTHRGPSRWLSEVLLAVATWVLDLVSFETHCSTVRATSLPGARTDRILRVPLGYPQQSIAVRPYDSSVRRPVILCVARVHRSKGQDILLQAFSLLAAKHPGWSLHMVGPVDDRGFLRELSEFINRSALSDRVTLFGYIDAPERDKEYLCSSIFCLPSISSESAGQVKYEATAYGLPVVTTDVPCRQDAEEMGWLVARAGDATNLAEQLEILMSDEAERKRLSTLAQSRLESYEDVAREMLSRLAEKSVGTKRNSRESLNLG